ncbi:MAG: DUF421 domain-containing protein, partial [Clostridia bacterium]|nr:DUF421 domain-containing protein [Clostridia bacterium]
YIFVCLGIRLMGKRQIGDMQPNELVVTLLISEIAAIPLQDTSQPVLNGVIAIFILVCLEIFISILTMKSMMFRKLMNGKSIVIIKNGQVDQAAMKKVRMTVLDLVELLRGENVFDISTVAFAVLEVNGNLSVLLKTEEQPVTKEDLKIQTNPEGMQIPVICDGKMIEESIETLNTTNNIINKKLKKEKTNCEKVFLMTMDDCENYNIINKEEK